MAPSERPIGEVVAEPRLPREAMLFFVFAPPVLAMLFDPHCLNTLDNILRAWLAITLFSCVTGFLVHHAFEWVERHLSGTPMALRLLAHLLTAALVVTLATFAQHPYVHFIYPEIGDDIAGVIWRALLVGVVYLSVASFVGHLQRRAIEERLKAHHARTAALEARLAMLQGQLQPHFLFNSLNVCAGLVHSAPDVAEATIDKLSAFLRYTLEASKEPMVPLARELEAVAAYLDIQRERFGDRLQHEIIVEGLLDDAPMLPPISAARRERAGARRELREGGIGAHHLQAHGRRLHHLDRRQRRRQQRARHGHRARERARATAPSLRDERPPRVPRDHERRLRRDRLATDANDVAPCRRSDGEPRMRVMIVDDEPVARQRLIRLLKDIPNTSVVGEAGDAREALALLPSLGPDLILLDVEMPGVDGLTLAALPTLPPVIFVTAHADRALQAFEVGAHDYLVKPVSLARLTAALDKVRARLPRTLEPANDTREPDEWWRLTVTEGTLRRFVDAREVACFSATDKYVSFKANERELLLRESLDALEARLGPHGFLRAHRGALVRRGAIEAFDQSEGGTLVLIDGERIPVSRRALPQIRAALGLTP